MSETKCLPFPLRLTSFRMTTPGHQARKVFYDDVNSTFNRIKSRTAELAAERAAEGQTEQIQLQAVEPGTEIHINVPQPDSEEAVEQQARAIFKTFPPGFQRALESGSLDRINEVLGKMSVEEAEEIVEQLGHSGMLDMRQGVIVSLCVPGLSSSRPCFRAHVFMPKRCCVRSEVR